MKNQKQQEQKHTEASAAMHNQQLMAQIVAEMKEIPVLPSEVPNKEDSFQLLKVEFPPTGGVLSYMDKQEYPYKGFPFFEFVDRIDLLKKFLKSFLSGFYHRMKERRLSLITLLPAVWIFKDLTRSGIHTAYRLVERFRLKPLRHCDAMRELHRAFTSYPGQDQELNVMLRDSLCMILEMDNAYRYRFQDVIVEIDKIKLKKNPSKELNRILSILQEREVTQEIRDSWKLVKYFVRYYLRIDKELRNIIVNALTELDYDKVKLSIEDISYCKPRKDYSFSWGKNKCQNYSSEDSKPQASSKSISPVQQRPQQSGHQAQPEI